MDVLKGLAKIDASGVTVDVAKALEFDLDPKWISRTIAVGVARQARSNLRVTKGPNGKDLPPLKENRLQLTRGGKRLVHAKRGIETGLLMRSLKSANVGVDAVFYVEGPRGQRIKGDVSAAEAVFLDTFKPNMDQRFIRQALQKVADRIPGAIKKDVPEDTD